MNQALKLMRFLIDAPQSGLASFTLLLIILSYSNVALGVESGSNPSSDTSLVGMTSPSASSSAFDSQEQHRRISLLVNYLRQTGTQQILPELPEAVRIPARLALNDFTSLRDEFGLTPAILEQERAIAAYVEPISNLVEPPKEDDEEAYWASPTYHHKGFLPLHDAMVLGVNARQHFLSNSTRLDTHPFFGQNWHSAANYMGVESTMSFFHTNAPSEPSWGKISIRYTYGNSAMMDQRPGFDLKSELRFTDEISLNAGVRQGDAIGLGNYVMLRWQITDFGR